MSAKTDDDDWTAERVCEECGRNYRPADQAEGYMEHPYQYQNGYRRYCLACWLGIGPKDFPEVHGPPAS